jgi:hypothetical protein
VRDGAVDFSLLPGDATLYLVARGHGTRAMFPRLNQSKSLCRGTSLNLREEAETNCKERISP